MELIYMPYITSPSDCSSAFHSITLMDCVADGLVALVKIHLAVEAQWKAGFMFTGKNPDASPAKEERITLQF